MRITIDSYLGVQHADLKPAPLALVIGPNGAGKSSIQAAVAAALTGQSLPPGINKKDAGILVNGAGSEASVTISTDTGSVSVTWPQCQADTTGQRPPRASEVAAGLVRLTDMDTKERAARLIDTLGAEPTFADLVEAVTTAGINVPAKGDDVAVESLRNLAGEVEASDDALAWCADLWKRIQGKGWDGAAKDLQSRGAELKGAWQNKTGEAYGAKKGNDWKPDLPTDPRHMDEEALQADVDAAKKEHEEALRKAGAGTAALEQARAKAAEPVPDVEALEMAFAEAEDAHAKAIDALSKTPRPDEGRHPKQPCPHCQEQVAIVEHREGAVRKFELKAPEPAPSETEIKEMRAARHEAEFAEQRAERAVHEAAAKANEAKRTAAAIEDAKAKLEKLEAEAAGAEGAEAAVEAARQKLNTAQTTLDNFRRWREARALHSEIVRLAAVVTIIKPNGLRQRVLSRVLADFNERLATLCDAVSWPRVAVKEDMTIVFGVRPAMKPICSEGQLWRTDTVLQVAIAQVDGSDIVLVDRADVLDPFDNAISRKQLLKMLLKARVPALVTMSATPSQVPDLHKAGKGGTWALVDGRARTLAELSSTPVQQAAE